MYPPIVRHVTYTSFFLGDQHFHDWACLLEAKSPTPNRIARFGIECTSLMTICEPVDRHSSSKPLALSV